MLFRLESFKVSAFKPATEIPIRLWVSSLNTEPVVTRRPKLYGSGAWLCLCLADRTADPPPACSRRCVSSLSAAGSLPALILVIRVVIDH
ncbi:hypothetical protein PoB_001853600 [Plakobranchus ocellatus]|uniref:Uncharacterized protein n=1 Tax=Plakobranchus ocellatus TaxID=259542 RepID=A0AAV3YY68_9GAST|nr:hypothetical protein PoB_001853600 [Plakobranchus ocellatus]